MCEKYLTLPRNEKTLQLHFYVGNGHIRLHKGGNTEKQSIILLTHRGIRRAIGHKYSVLPRLSRIFFKQLRAGPILLDLGMQFVYVISHRQQKNFGRYLLLSAQKKLTKPIVLLYNSKCTF